jgi:hypothetical protein
VGRAINVAIAELLHEELEGTEVDGEIVDVITEPADSSDGQRRGGIPAAIKEEVETGIKRLPAEHGRSPRPSDVLVTSL